VRGVRTPDPASRRKQADLASSAGAGVLGAGLGILLAERLAALAVPLLLVGVALHGWGMLEKRRLEAGMPVPRWSLALYWLCWAALGILVAWIGLIAWKG
jgi:hypothetical protein